MLPDSVRIVEVGPRDGLQNEATIVPTPSKIEFVNALVDAGLTEIEVTSFVSPRHIPQLGDAAELAGALSPREGVRLSALVPNARGLERAREAGIRRIALFTAASDTFTEKNIGMTVARSLTVFGEVAHLALEMGISIRGYVSTAFECPFEGAVSPQRVLEVTEQLLALGADEISLGDTIGVAAPTEVERLIELLRRRVPLGRLALHFHDTSGTALANVVAGLSLGITTFDASAGGLGGCPYAPGAAGNLATEDLVYLLQRMGIHTGVDLGRLAQASAIIERTLGRRLPSRQLQRLGAASAAETRNRSATRGTSREAGGGDVAGDPAAGTPTRPR